jgi:DNA-binding LacI/PurR family transcriptional regulator/signal transduction histidine kinase
VREQGRPSHGSKRPTIGLLLDSLFGSHEEELWVGMRHAAEALDLNLLCFVGGPLWERHSSAAVYCLATPHTVDGLIACSSELGNFIPDAQLVELFRRYAPLPLVSLGRTVPGTAGILVDNATGIRQVMSHLIEVHGRKRIAFVRGPPMSDEAEDRFRAYRESLEAHGLPYDPLLVLEGTFWRESGTHAMRALVDERRVPFDAVLAASDYMAIYAMKELRRRGFRIPEDVALAGFDGIPDGLAVTPTLTTAQQPLREMGSAAVKQVLAMMHGESFPERRLFSSEMVVRRSCGCSPIPLDLIGLTPRSPLVPHLSREAELAARLEALFPGAAESVGSPSWSGDLAAGLLSDLAGRTDQAFSTEVERLLEHVDPRMGTATQWTGLVLTAFDAVRPPPEEAVFHRWTALRANALASVGNVSEQAQIGLRMQHDETSKVLLEIFYWTHLDRESMQAALREGLPMLAIRSLFLARYADPTQETATPFFQFSLTDHVQLDPTIQTFPSKWLVPGKFTEERRYAFVVLSLLPEAGEAGFAVFELAPISGVSYQYLINEIRRMLKVTSLMDEVTRYANELELRVEERTRQLEEAQQRLLESAHQAGMAEIAVGVLHNVGNLLNTVSVSAEGITQVVENSKLPGLAKANELLAQHQSELPSFFASDPRAGLLPQYYAKVTASLQEERTRIRADAVDLLDKVSILRETIRMLQEHARDGQDMLLLENLDLAATVDAALKIQANNAARYHVAIRSQYDRVPRILLSRAKMIHVLVNLFKNAIEAMRLVPDERRVLTVEVQEHGERGARVRVTDSGEGIAAGALGRIFSFGFTTKKDGHGFGLHTCANYVKQMGGSIRVESEGPGRGATFEVVFEGKPLTEPEPRPSPGRTPPAS